MKEEDTIDAKDEVGQQESKNILLADIRRAVLISAIVTAITLASSLIINVSSGSEARLLLSGMLPSIRFLSSAVMTASATTLALMLALVGFGQGTDSNLKALHYDRVEKIAFWNLIVFIAASSLLLFITLPLSESQAQEIPTNWYQILYYVILFYSGTLIGALTFVVVLLFRTIKSVINALHPNRNSSLIRNSD